MNQTDLHLTLYVNKSAKEYRTFQECKLASSPATCVYTSTYSMSYIRKYLRVHLKHSDKPSPSWFRLFGSRFNSLCNKYVVLLSLFLYSNTSWTGHRVIFTENLKSLLAIFISIYLSICVSVFIYFKYVASAWIKICTNLLLILF